MRVEKYGWRYGRYKAFLQLLPWYRFHAIKTAKDKNRIQRTNVYRCLNARQPGKVLNGLNPGQSGNSQNFHWKILSNLWILVEIDCAKIAGQILDSSERQCTICLFRSSCFWHIALIVIFIILREKEIWARWIWRRHWLQWEREDAWKLEDLRAKTNHDKARKCRIFKFGACA